MAPPLLLSRRFAPLFWCQFFAAFNDNFLKTSLVFLILFGADVTSGQAEVLITLAGAVFIAPYFFLSGLGGEIADRHDKARVAQWLKFVEIFIACLALYGHMQKSGVIMFVLGSGPVKGFAVVLLIGIVTSVFTAVTFTRMLVAGWLRRAKPKTINI